MKQAVDEGKLDGTEFGYTPTEFDGGSAGERIGEVDLKYRVDPFRRGLAQHFYDWEDQGESED